MSGNATTATIPAVTPDQRGRVTLGSLIDRDRTYMASADRGVITLTPIAVQLSDEELADLRADPEGFARLLERDLTPRTGPTMSVDEFFDAVDAGDD